MSPFPAWITESNQTNAYYGGHLQTAGDVNGDGYSDVIVAAAAYDNGQSDEGRVVLFLPRHDERRRHGADAGTDAQLPDPWPERLPCRHRLAGNHERGHAAGRDRLPLTGRPKLVKIYLRAVRIRGEVTTRGASLTCGGGEDMRTVFSVSCCLVLLAIVMTTPVARGQEFVWARQLGGVGTESPSRVTVDAAGNVYTVGSFHDTTDFDPGAGVFSLTSPGQRDAFVSKLDRSGNFVWAKQLGGETWNDDAQGVAVDSEGNVYTVGVFANTADFDPGAGTFTMTSASADLNDVFVSKLDSTGSFVWARRLGGTGFDFVEGVAVDAVGNIYAAGNFANDVFIAKLDSSGNALWVKQLGGWMRASGVAVDSVGNVYTVGYFANTADFDPGPGTSSMTSASANLYDVFISKLNGSGAFVWARQLGGTLNDSAGGVAVDPGGHVCTVGQFAATADFDPGPGAFNLTSVGGSDVFISKLDSSGNFFFAKRLGGTPGEDAYGVAVDGIGNVYTTGIFYGTVDFDPDDAGTFILTSEGNGDAFVVELDSFGYFVWAVRVGATGADMGAGVVVGSGGFYSTGYFTDTVDFDPGPGVSTLTSTNLNPDAFVYRLAPSIRSGTVPDGSRPFHLPLSITKNGDELFLQWDSSCGPLDGDFEIYEGALESFTSHVPLTCSNGVGMNFAFITPTPGNRYYLVVSQALGLVEGSYGQDSSGAERPPSAAACLPQSILSCP